MKYVIILLLSTTGIEEILKLLIVINLPNLGAKLIPLTIQKLMKILNYKVFILTMESY